MHSPPLDPNHRMPTVFGPAPGPRNLPADRQRLRYANRRLSISVSALTEAAALSRYLPPKCRLVGEPLVNVTVSALTELGWLAGRGYNIVSVRFPNVEFSGGKSVVTAAFGAVTWENLADPILTGREELGIPKIYAEIPRPMMLGTRVECSASWLGFRFFDLTMEDAQASPAPATSERSIQMVQKYFPQTGALDEADMHYMTMTGADRLEPPSTVHRYLRGTGRFSFSPARWEDMPTQYVIVNALAGLPLLDFRGATLTESSQGEVDTVGGGSLGGQHRIE